MENLNNEQGYESSLCFVLRIFSLPLLAYLEAHAEACAVHKRLW